MSWAEMCHVMALVSTKADLLQQELKTRKRKEKGEEEEMEKKTK